jgi:hypothetical protein
MLFLWIVWAALTLFVITLAVMRKVAARKEDDLLHLSGSPEPVIAQQFATAGKLAMIDRWGKLLTVVDVAFGFVLLVVMLVLTYVHSVSLQQ